jgi:protein disulfide-isomerase
MNSTLRFFIGLTVASLLALSVRAAEWTDNYAAALAKAKAEHKLVLLDFTGSDWCIWCKRTDSDLFSKQKFKDFADRNLELVTVDFPRSHELDARVGAQNEALKDKYGIRAFPTLIVLDPSEKIVVTQEGYLEGGPEAFIAQFPKDRK